MIRCYRGSPRSHSNMKGRAPLAELYVKHYQKHRIHVPRFLWEKIRMPHHTEANIQNLCARALTAKAPQDVDQIAQELRAALEEHIQLAKNALEGQLGNFPLLDTIAQSASSTEEQATKKVFCRTSRTARRTTGRDYDLFEVMPDGSPVWRGTASGRRNAVRKLAQLASETRNEVRAIHLLTKALIAEMNVPQRNA